MSATIPPTRHPVEKVEALSINGWILLLMVEGGVGRCGSFGCLFWLMNKNVCIVQYFYARKIINSIKSFI